MIGSWRPLFSAWSMVSWKQTQPESWSFKCRPARLGGREQDVLQMHWSLFCCSRLLGVVRIYENQKIRFLPNILLFHLELHINCTHLCTLWKAHCEVLLLPHLFGRGHSQVFHMVPLSSSLGGRAFWTNWCHQSQSPLKLMVGTFQERLRYPTEHSDFSLKREPSHQI